MGGVRRRLLHISWRAAGEEKMLGVSTPRCPRCAAHAVMSTPLCPRRAAHAIAHAADELVAEHLPASDHGKVWAEGAW